MNESAIPPHLFQHNQCWNFLALPISFTNLIGETLYIIMSKTAYFSCLSYISFDMKCIWISFTPTELTFSSWFLKAFSI